MAYANAYEKLYDSMKNKFTLIKNNNEYSLGEYMAEKARAFEKSEDDSRITSPSSIISYVSEKLNSKKDRRSGRAFPVRSLASACLSLLVVSTLVLSFGLFANNENTTPLFESSETTGENVEFETLSHEIKF